jgi:hypothetical protein
MKVFIVTGEHFDVPNTLQSVHFDRPAADAKALHLVNLIRADVPADPDQPDEQTPALPALKPGADWEAGLAEAQRIKAEWTLGFPLAELDLASLRGREIDDPDLLAEMSECYVQIVEMEAEGSPDGPYRPELAEAFRQGARELQIDRLDIAAGATVEEGEGGAFVACRVYVSDSERLPMPGEDDAYVANVMTPGCSVEGDEHQSGPGTFTVTGRPLFEIQCQAADEAEAAKRWHEALHDLANPATPDVDGLEIAFFSDEAKGGHLVSDLYVDRLEDDDGEALPS